MDYGIICTLAAYDLIARRLITDRSKHSWLLSLPVTGLISVMGIYHAAHWLLTGDISQTALTVATTRILKNYMLVELCSELFYNFENIAILETVIHHVAYYYFLDHLIAIRITGYLQPFFVFEIPTFMRTLSRLFPQFRHDLAFGVCFGFFRVAWPLYVVTVLRFPEWHHYVFFTSIEAVHIYWLYVWLSHRFS